MTNSQVIPGPLGVLDRNLQDLLDDRRATPLSSVVGYLLDQGAADKVRVLLNAICDDVDLTARCAARSFSHPLGFDKFTLLATPRYHLRLHIWWPNSRRSREHIHNHRFGFCSTVIMGRLQVDEYRIGDSGEQMTRFSEGRDEDRRAYLFHEVGAVAAQHMATTLLGPGSSYYASREVLHRVTAVINVLTASLFLRLPATRQLTTVLLNPSSGPPPSAERLPFSPQELRARLRQFVLDSARQVPHMG